MGKELWEARIKEATMGGDYDLAFTDGSKLEDGRTGARWTVRNQLYGGKGLGAAATVWGAEITAIAETLKHSKGKRLLILSDSKAAVAAVVKAGKRGQGRTKELREATDLIAERCRKDGTAVCLSWVKSHIGIEGMKRQTVTNTNCAIEGNLELMIKRGDIDNKRLVTSMVKI